MGVFWAGLGYGQFVPEVLQKSWYLASSPGHTQLFQRMYEKSGRAWYQKSHGRHHGHTILRSQKVGLKLKLF